VVESRYARPEYERRFLLDHLPDDVSDPVRILPGAVVDVVEHPAPVSPPA